MSSSVTGPATDRVLGGRYRRALGRAILRRRAVLDRRVRLKIRAPAWLAYALGLVVLAVDLRVAIDRRAGAGPVGTVKRISPTGALEAGTLVTLGVVASEPEPRHDDEDAGKPGKGKGRDKHDERDD